MALIMVRTMMAAIAASGAMSFVSMPAAQASDITAFFSNYTAGSSRVVNHAAWSRLLKTYVKPVSRGVNRVDYGRWKSHDHGALKAYIKGLEAVAVARLDRAEQFAFWANLYNAKTIDVVIDHYPVDSIRKISLRSGLFGYLKKSIGLAGPWKAKIITVSGRQLSLDDIEHGILRPVFKDPRVHYAVNCASIGCPDLRPSAFSGANLGSDLDAAAKAYINDVRAVKVTHGKVTVSSIYNWFVRDFGGETTGVLAHLRAFASNDLKRKLKGISNIDQYHYDWSLNDIVK